MNKNEKRKLLTKKEANKAVELLKDKISQVRHVRDWALLAGCSKTKLNQLMNIQFGLTSKPVFLIRRNYNEVTV